MIRREPVVSRQSHPRPSQSLMGVERPFSSFVKPILPSILEAKKLRIPEKFAKKFGEELSEVVKVVDPTGHAWEIGLAKAENNIWFDDGWQKFVDYYSIGFGYFIVFKYGGLSNFYAHIFDISACEIPYRRSGPASGEEINHVDNRLVHDEAVLTEDDAPNIKILDSAIPTAPLGALESRVSGESASKEQSLGTKTLHTGVASDGNPNSEQQLDDKMSKKNMEEESPVTVMLNDVNETRKKLRSFVAAQRISPSSQQLGDKMSKKHMEESLVTVVSDDANNESRYKLQNCVAAQWSPISEMLGDKKTSEKHMEEESHVNVVSDDPTESLKKLHRCVAAQGSFSSENLCDKTGKMHMEEEDIETMVLDDGANDQPRKRKVLNQHQSFGRPGSLSKETKADNSKSKTKFDENEIRSKSKEDIETVVSRFPNASEASKRALQAAKTFKTESPSFIKLLQPYNFFAKIVNVPHGFARRYLTRVSDYIKLKVSDEREWPVKLTAKKLVISKGWHAFQTENDLKEGDVCVFEIIKNNKPEFKVTIFRADDQY